MEPNVGGLDRTARIVLGIVLVVASMGVIVLGGDLGRTTQALLGGGALLVAAILLATAWSRQCMINRVLGINTYRRSERE